MRHHPNRGCSIGQACEMGLLETRRMLSASLDGRMWLVRGDADPLAPADAIVIDVDPTQSTRLRAVINGTTVGTIESRAIDTIWVSGGEGDDRILVTLTAAFERIRLRLDGGNGNDTLLGGATRDELRGGRGNDRLDGGAGADLIRGDAGDDDVAGDDGDDILFGHDGADTLSGGWGRDQLTGGAGNDHLRGGADGDFLYGNAGKDVLRGGDGRDRLIGGPDRDRLYRESSRDQVIGTASEIRLDDDNSGSVIRMTDRDAWADAIIQAGLRLHRQQFGITGGSFAYDGFVGGIGGSWSVINTFNGAMRLGAADAVLFAANNVTGAADQSFSTTNTQVAGIDEADIVETDGRYIYSLTSGKLAITDVGNPRAMRVLSTTSLGDAVPVGMYLDGTKLTVISTIFESDGTQPPEPIAGRFLDYYIPGKQRTQVTSFDVSDPAAIRQIASSKLDGWYQSSRLIDGRLYVVVNNGMGAIYPQTVVEDDQWRMETEAEYSARVRNDVLDFSLEVTVTRDGTDVDGELIDPATVYLPARADSDLSQLTTVVMIDTSNPRAGPVSSATFAGTGGITYASADALYLVNNGWGDVPSKIVKFDLAGTNLTVEATGTFDGQINNQFSLDQHDRNLRVAYTRGFGTDRTNGVLVLDQIGDELSTVGELGGLARGESIFSARFIGDEAYLVTFLQTDPLFTIDLSNPTRPQLVGELVIPGFSRYLHPLDENHLIGFGRNADETGRTRELQLSLFDVTDRAHPRRVDAISIAAEDWSRSEAEWNHLAFQYNAAEGVILIPAFDGSGSRIELIRVDASDGFERIGAVTDPSDSTPRAVWIGGTVFAVGAQSIRAADISTAATRGEVAFNQG